MHFPTLDAYRAWALATIATKKGPAMPKLPSELMPHIGDRIGFVIRRDGINRYHVANITGGFSEGFATAEIGRIEVKDARTFTWESAVNEGSGGEASFAAALHKLTAIWLNH